MVGKMKYTLFCGRRGTDEFTSIMITQPDSMWVYCTKTLTERKCRVEKPGDKGNNETQGLENVFKSIQAKIWAVTFK